MEGNKNGKAGQEGTWGCQTTALRDQAVKRTTQHWSVAQCCLIWLQGVISTFIHEYCERVSSGFKRWYNLQIKLGKPEFSEATRLAQGQTPDRRKTQKSPGHNFKPLLLFSDLLEYVRKSGDFLKEN